MCYRLGCLFKSVRKPPDDGFIRILIFGATGMTGTAVLSAALTCIWFRITIFTRGLSGTMREEMLKKPLARIVEGDMFNYDSVLDAMTDIDAVFFSTTYWDTMRVDCEYDQGCNVVKAAMASGVKHIVYVGTPYCSLYATEKCKYLVGKEKVEALVVSSGLPYTILHLGFYFENFLSVFKPHMIERNKFAVALPMGNTPLNCGSVLDFGHCIAKIMLRPAANIFKTIKLATAYHTVYEFAKALDDHFPNIQFYDPLIPLSVYRSFDFKGSQELASMFAYYQTIEERWSSSVGYGFYTGCVSFRDWIVQQEQNLIEAIYESVDPVCSGAELDLASRKSQLPVLRAFSDRILQTPEEDTSGLKLFSTRQFIRNIFNFFNESPKDQPVVSLEESEIELKSKAPAEVSLQPVEKERRKAFLGVVYPPPRTELFDNLIEVPRSSLDGFSTTTSGSLSRTQAASVRGSSYDNVSDIFFNND